jgi:hypothetical protein
MKRKFGSLLMLLTVFVSPAFAQRYAVSPQFASDIRVATPTPTVSMAQKGELATAARIIKSCSTLPLSFEPNQGQADTRVKFLSRGSAYSLLVTTTEAVFFLAEKPKTADSNAARLNRNAFRIKLIGANPSPKITALEKLPSKSNYLIGNDPAKWRTGIAHYAKIRIEGVYPGIDLVYYGNQRNLEYDWVVAPGSNQAAIRFEIKGAERAAIDAGGDLVIKLRGEEIRLHKPLAYQEEDAVRTKVATEYLAMEKNQFGFWIDQFDRSVPLVIDPVLTYSTYLGGAGDDAGTGIAIDSAGNAYVVGKTRSDNFPATNPVQGISGGGGYDAFVAKLNAPGDGLIYFTYLGGSSNDYGEAIAVDSDGFAYLAGSTYSSNFPMKNPFQAKSGGGGYEDAFIAKLNTSGDALVYSTYLGGNGRDGVYGIAVDSAKNAYVTGRTFSTNFPTANPYQASNGGRGDAFVTKLNSSGSALVYSTYLGGNGDGYDWGWGIAVDTSGNAYVVGATYSYDFPTRNPFQGTYGGSMDAFVTKLDASGNRLVYSTYLGGSWNDAGHAIAVDSEGSVYVTGYTISPNFPTANAFQSTGTGDDAFVAKLNTSGNELLYSTYLGGNGADFGNGIALDSSGNAYVTGYTESANFPSMNSIQETLKGSGDAFVTVLNASGDSLLFSTYLGGSQSETMIIGERNGGIGVDSAGNAYVVGMTSSINFPTANPFQASYGGGSLGSLLGGDSFVTKLSPLKSTSMDLKITSGGAGKISTAGRESSTRIGYAAATVTSGNAPYGVAVFSYRQGGIVISEAAVPVSPPTTSAMVFIDHRAGVSAIPGRPGAGTIDINTGIALVNTGSATADITYTLRDLNGQTLAVGHGTAEAGEHYAKFIDQLKDIAPNFALPSDFQFGPLEIASNQPLSVLALRGTMNQRDEFLMTTTPVADLTRLPSSDSLFFPQLADGGGYTTALLLLNTSSQIESGKLQIYDKNGTPVTVNQVGGTNDFSFRYSIPAGGAFQFQTDGFPTSVKTGWVRLMPDAGNPAPVGSGLFAYNPSDVLVSESGIPDAIATTHARIYVDLSNNHNTGLAIANINPAPASISVRAFQPDGTTPTGFPFGPLSLVGGGYDAKFVDQLFWGGLPAGFKGILDIASSMPFAALTLRSLTNERNEFLMTAFPIADMTRAAPSPIVFPQVADGGGYMTEFILISAGQAAGTTLNYYDESGMPTNFGR